MTVIKLCTLRGTLISRHDPPTWYLPRRGILIRDLNIRMAILTVPTRALKTRSLGVYRGLFV